ncbi:hypothetical protein [Lentibacillus sp. Marseille-P4043]|uniref:hypothetical protein n=1 Tax=Lentibacillus sp. Marseille-P4043 TaxID=2040293 RepID=UPI000D0B4550|nr:hypothetical protein [Lentibacillus sp. Marseille-P4043]
MTSYMNKIERYGREIRDLTVSPFETMEMLHLRSALEKEISNMDENEQLRLLYFDLEVIQNIQNIYEHINNIYDFSTSKEPDTEWWWHLDKVINGEIRIKSYPLYTEKNIAL